MIIRAIATAVPVVLAGWIGLLLSLTVLTDEAPAMIVLFPTTEFVNNLPADVLVTAWSNHSVTLTSEQANLAAQLYASGARIVLPAGLPGCGS